MSKRVLHREFIGYGWIEEYEVFKIWSVLGIVLWVLSIVVLTVGAWSTTILVTEKVWETILCTILSSVLTIICVTLIILFATCTEHDNIWKKKKRFVTKINA